MRRLVWLIPFVHLTLVSPDAALAAPPGSARAPMEIALTAARAQATFALRGGASVRGVEGCGETLFAGVLPGADAFVRETDDGAETSLRFRERPETETMAWTFDASDGEVELDEDGAFEWHADDGAEVVVRALTAVDASGERHEVELDVEGATPTRDPDADDAPACAIVVRWGGEIGDAVEYPVVLDTSFELRSGPTPSALEDDGADGDDDGPAFRGCDVGGAPRQGVAAVGIALALATLGRRSLRRATRREAAT